MTSTQILSDDEILAKRDRDAFDSGFEAGIGWAMSPENIALNDATKEMYEALMSLRSFMWSEGYADQTEQMAKADAAIAKAEGK